MRFAERCPIVYTRQPGDLPLVIDRCSLRQRPSWRINKGIELNELSLFPAHGPLIQPERQGYHRLTIPDRHAGIIETQGETVLRLREGAQVDHAVTRVPLERMPDIPWGKHVAHNDPLVVDGAGKALTTG